MSLPMGLPDAAWSNMGDLDDDYITEALPIIVLICCLSGLKRKRHLRDRRYSMMDRIPQRVKHLTRLIGVTNADCIANLRMDRNTFGRLVLLLRQAGGLVDSKYVSVEEQTASFLGILAHHKKNRVVGFDYWRSGQTVSRYVHVVLNAILMLHGTLLVKPEPVPNDCTDSRWKWFKGCLGALDGTYINVKVPGSDKARYRTRKGHISTNTLAACDKNLLFVYVLPGWEGSAADSRVLRDAVNRHGGFKVPKGILLDLHSQIETLDHSLTLNCADDTGNYYLADNGYANSEGFLTPYRGVRYHLKQWGPANVQPANQQEMFNMRHSKARNVIERAFGVMKMRWGILRSASYYPIKTQIKLIGACFLLHNFIRSQMEVDPMDELVDADAYVDEGQDFEEDVEYIEIVESSAEWNVVRDGITNAMWLGE